MIVDKSSAVRGLAAILMATLAVVTPARAQNVDLGGIIGGLMQGAIQSETQGSQQEVRKRPRSLDRTPTVQNGGDDSQLLGSDPKMNAKVFVVDGHGLGDRLSPGHLAPDFSLSPSEQFPGFQWCRRRKEINSIITNTSILISSNNEIEYYNKYYESAHFEPGAVQGEIKRIADLNQARPRILKMGRNAEGTSAVIALWGSLVLTPLDSQSVSLLASGQAVNSGILIDFLGDYRASARRGLPVYKISAGFGYYWAARFNDGGDGTLRFGIADASVFNAAAAPAQATTNQALAFSEVTPTAIVPPMSPVGSVSDASAEAEAKERADQAEAEAHAARNEAAAKLRKAQFERASTNAKKVIDDASAFVKANAATPKLLDYVQQIADLNGTLSASDPTITETKTQALLRSLQDDTDFQRFRDEREKQRQRQIARDLGDAVHTLASQRQFLIGYVTRDPTSANATKLLPLIRQAEGAVASPDLDRVQTLLGQIDVALQVAGLSDEFAASQKLQQPDKSTHGDTAPSSDARKLESTEAQQKTGVQLVETEKNAFLLKGDLQDVVLMYNSSPNAPHVVRNLRGDIVFTEGRADVCLFGRDGDDSELSLVVRSTLSAYNTAKTVVLGGDPCNADQLNTYDVVATRRGTFLRQDPEAALALIKAIEIDAFKSLVTVTDAQLKAEASADAVAATEIAADVDKGVKEGFGLILLAGNSAAICLVAQDQVEAHRQLLVGHAERLASDMRAAPTLSPVSPDGAFVNAKRGQCGAIYAQSAELKELAGAFKRDGLAYRFSSVWIETDRVKGMADKLRIEYENAARQSAERQRRQSEEQHLASLRVADEASKLANLQAASRDKYMSSANASQAKIAADVKEFTDHPDNGEGVARVFPTFASLYRNELADRWELMSENAALEDYGMSDFKGRKLETAFSRINIGLKNRMLGDYKSECFIFGEIEDSEFAMHREPIAVSCDDDAALSSWKVQHGFKSVWTLSTADPTAIGRY